MTVPALDTSVAVPLLVRAHAAHGAVVRWWDGRPVVLAGHALAETYSVLTRLPGDSRLDPGDAARLIAERFGSPLILPDAVAADLPTILARAGIAGGAVYDALVGLCAAAHDVVLATRDARARGTYDAVGARSVVVGG
ncbi:type II toxin-antitoxin system VapC family toxin [Pseudonocardia nematodicida]|uniref:Ribonuclease VapC n=1 Tax=Pseudonocardia nematodicida TaxID=1206997 RepID=A0ABV1KBX8_9PSEU